MLYRAPKTFAGVKLAGIKYLETGRLGGKRWFIEAVGYDFDHLMRLCIA